MQADALDRGLAKRSDLSFKAHSDMVQKQGPKHQLSRYTIGALPLVGVHTFKLQVTFLGREI